MDGVVDITETRQGKALQRLAAVGGRLVELIAERAEEAETTAELAVCADAYAKVSRAVRMTIALEAKLVRDMAAFHRANRAEHELATREAVARRRLALRNTIAAEMCREWEGEQELVDEAIDDLQERLEHDSQLATFLEEPLDYQVERLKTLFGLDGREVPDLPEGWNDVDDEDDEDETSNSDAAAAKVEVSYKPKRYGGPPDDPFEIGEVTVIGMGPPKPDDTS